MGRLSERDFQRLADASTAVAESPFFVDDTPELTLPLLELKTRQFALENPRFLLVVDYLQLVTGRKSGPFEGRQSEVAEISRRLKILARELSVPVVALSQLSRAVEARPNKRPMLSDLRESGGLEQDADLVMFIYRDEYYVPQTEKQGIAEVIIGKQRNGPVGTIEVQFHNAHVRFNDLARSVL